MTSEVYSMLQVIDLGFDHQDTPLFEQVNFQVPPGGLLHLRGANGSGKTTLLKLIAGLYQPQKGEIQFAGESIQSLGSEYQKKMCFIGHKSGLSQHLSLKENYLYGAHVPPELDKLTELASIFNLSAHLDTPCGLLSAGQKKQVSLLGLWIRQAPLWLLDEPLVALDDTALEILMVQIHQHRQKGGCVVLSSHQALPLPDSDYQEYFLC